MYSSELLDVPHPTVEQAHHFCTTVPLKEYEGCKTREVTQANKLHVSVLCQESGNNISLGCLSFCVDEV